MFVGWSARGAALDWQAEESLASVARHVHSCEVASRTGSHTEQGVFLVLSFCLSFFFGCLFVSFLCCFSSHLEFSKHNQTVNKNQQIHKQQMRNKQTNNLFGYLLRNPQKSSLSPVPEGPLLSHCCGCPAPLHSQLGIRFTAQVSMAAPPQVPQCRACCCCFCAHRVPMSRCPPLQPSASPLTLPHAPLSIF